MGLREIPKNLTKFDVWSACVLGFELAINRRLFPGNKETEIEKDISPLFHIDFINENDRE